MSVTPSLILQVGTPRTGSTTLQRHAFTKINGYLCFHKRAYAFIGNGGACNSAIDNTDIRTLSGQAIACTLKDLVNDLKSDPASISRYSNFLFQLASAGALSPRFPKDVCALFVEIILAYASAVVEKLQLPGGILIAAERLSNSFFAIDSRFQGVQRMLLVEVLINAWRGLHGDASTDIQISACLRDPIPHLASRYKRFLISLSVRKLPMIGVEEYIAMHVSRHKKNPIDSALFPALHRQFIEYHERLGNVKPFGFKELLACDDTLSLIGLSGKQDKIPFSSLPVENKDRSSLEERAWTEKKVIATLKGHGYLKLVADSQLFV